MARRSDEDDELVPLPVERDPVPVGEPIQNLHAASLDPAGGDWQALPHLPVAFTDCVPRGAVLGGMVFAEHCGRGALFRVADGAWEEIPHPRSLAEEPVWTGTEALFWVGSFAGSTDGLWRYRPS